MVCLDTHALLWWALDPGKLSRLASDKCAQMEKDGGYASAISVWELGIKIKRGKLDIGIGIDEFAHRLERAGVVKLVPVDSDIWLRSLNLDWEHRDPANRIIVATSLRLGLPLLSKDSQIARYADVHSIW